MMNNKQQASVITFMGQKRQCHHIYVSPIKPKH